MNPQTAQPVGTRRAAARRGRARVRRFLAGCLLAFATLASPQPAGAQQEKDVETDARLEGYQGTEVKVENSSTALTWLGFIVLGVVGLAALFKDAKRTHLD